MLGSSIYARLQNAYPSFWHNHLQSKQAGTYRQKTAHCVGWALAPKSTTSMYMFYANEMSIFQEFIHS